MQIIPLRGLLFLMANLLTSSQALRSSILFPRGVHSRLLTLEFFASAGMGNFDFQFSDIVGNNVWILGISVWAHGDVAGSLIGAFVHITTGVGLPTDATVIAVEWENIIANKGLKPYLSLTGFEKGWWRFDMNRLYTGNSRRFGIVVENLSSTNQFRGSCAIQISEG